MSGVTIHVCVSCRTDGGAPTPDAFADALAALAEGEPGIAVAPVACLGVCRRPVTVALAGGGRWTYVLGDAAAPEAVLDAARLYAGTDDGIVPWKARPALMKSGIVARIPPLAAVPEMTR